MQDWHNLNWTSSGVLVQGLYGRILYEITPCNGFLAEAIDDKLSARGISGTDPTDIKAFRAEVRFLRALAYYHALDLYGNPPFATENDPIGGTTPPKQISRADLFAYIESELKAIDADLLPPSQSAGQYARANKAAARTLLAKLYLNAQVYTGNAAGRYADCLTYAAKVIDQGGYSLQTASTATASAYARNFLADNNTSPEIIFPITFDGKRTES